MLKREHQNCRKLTLVESTEYMARVNSGDNQLLQQVLKGVKPEHVFLALQGAVAAVTCDQDSLDLVLQLVKESSTDIKTMARSLKAATVEAKSIKEDKEQKEQVK